MDKNIKFDFKDAQELGSRMTPDYLAGFFDGEGSVTACGRGFDRVPTIQVNLTQTGLHGLLLLAMIASRFGGGPYEKKRPSIKNWEPCYRCTWTGSSAKPFLEYIKNSVILKKKLVDSALDFIELLGHRGGPTPTIENVEKRTELASKISNLNDAARRAGESVQ